MTSFKFIIAVLFLLFGNDNVCQAMETTVFDSIKADGVKTYKTLSNKKFAGQVNERNTVYIIKKHYNLKGGTVFIPAGCELRFEGGSIKNGTLVFDGTVIGGNKKNSVFRAVKLKGRVAGALDAKWFKEKVSLDTLLAIADNEVHLLEHENYQLYSNMVIPHSNIMIDGKGATISYYQDGINISLNGKDDVTFNNIIELSQVNIHSSSD